jgi:hypothetical protein
MAARDRPSSDPAPPNNDWRRTTAGFLLGVVAVGVTVNLLSEHGYPALTLITGLGAVFAVAHWLRRYPNSGMQRTVQYTLWALAAGCTAVAAATPGRWTGWLVLAAAGLLAVTVLLKEGLHEAGFGPLAEGTVLAGASVVVGGVAFLMSGSAWLVGLPGMLASATALLGVAALAAGTAAVFSGYTLPGAAMLATGAALTVAGFVHLGPYPRSLDDLPGGGQPHLRR